MAAPFLPRGFGLPRRRRPADGRLPGWTEGDNGADENSNVTPRRPPVSENASVLPAEVLSDPEKSGAIEVHCHPEQRPDVVHASLGQRQCGRVAHFAELTLNDRLRFDPSALTIAFIVRAFSGCSFLLWLNAMRKRPPEAFEDRTEYSS